MLPSKRFFDIYQEIDNVWEEAALHVASKNPKHFEVDLNASIFSYDYANVLNHLNLLEEAELDVPTKPWGVYLTHFAKRIKNKIDRALSRHSTMLKPEFAASLHAIETSHFIELLESQEDMPLIDQHFGNEYEPFLMWGPDASVDEFVDTMNEFGEQLAASLPEYIGMPDLPDEFDPYLPSRVPEILRDLGIRQPLSGGEAGDD